MIKLLTPFVYPNNDTHIVVHRAAADTPKWFENILLGIVAVLLISITVLIGYMVYDTIKNNS